MFECILPHFLGTVTYISAATQQRHACWALVVFCTLNLFPFSIWTCLNLITTCFKSTWTIGPSVFLLNWNFYTASTRNCLDEMFVILPVVFKSKILFLLMSFFSSSHVSFDAPHVSIHSLVSDYSYLSWWLIKYVNPTIENIKVLTTYLDITTTWLNLCSLYNGLHREKRVI